jgi:hypothetical protein
MVLVPGSMGIFAVFSVLNKRVAQKLTANIRFIVGKEPNKVVRPKRPDTVGLPMDYFHRRTCILHTGSRS